MTGRADGRVATAREAAAGTAGAPNVLKLCQSSTGAGSAKTEADADDEAARSQAFTIGASTSASSNSNAVPSILNNVLDKSIKSKVSKNQIK